MIASELRRPEPFRGEEGVMAELHEALAARVAKWRADGYPSAYPAIAEILEYAIADEQEGRPFPATGSLRYLRAAQLRALETYWYVRLVLRTPHVDDLYRELFPGQRERLEALGLTSTDLKDLVIDHGVDGLLQRIKTDDELVATHRLEALRETLKLAYPSYILALAMGAGKTVLIGAIVATEFAMALEYPSGGSDDEVQFVENALVFAPGKTIIESLRELTQVPYERILPPRLFRPFNTAFKPLFTQDRSKDIDVIRGSSFNLIVTNTEKIRIQARPVRRTGLAAIQLAALEEQAREEANMRLQAIASLPHLAVFSDEAHHTYGQALGAELKRVRQTVDYLASNSPNLICVINTTGTPYYERRPLKDVVFWYGLSQGIADGILKEVADNIQSFDFRPDQAGEFVAHVVKDFFGEYADVAIADGAPAKLAIYFPQTDDLDELRPRVELALAQAGRSADIVLAHTSKTGKDAEDAFNRLNDARSRHRVVLLVNKGTEGWNCPSLFATALARKLTSSNNFVLQAASRCLRQVPGNDQPAKIYLSNDNRSILDQQLRETYGETIADLNRAARETKRDRIRVDAIKVGAAPMMLRRPRRTVRRLALDVAEIRLTRPSKAQRDAIVGVVLEIAQEEHLRRLLRAVGDEIVVETPIATTDRYSAAVELAASARLAPMQLAQLLEQAYGSDEIPLADLPALNKQIEEQTAKYEVVESDEEVPLRILKPDGFESLTDGNGHQVLEAEISYPADKAALVFGPDYVKDNPRRYGFHYAPYNFDSNPEVSYFLQLLRTLNRESAPVEDVYFIGALTDPAKTDLVFEYRRADGKRAYYTPDFLIRCKDEKCYLVEIKAARDKADEINGENGRKAQAVRELIKRNGDRVGYEMIFTNTDEVLASDLVKTRAFVQSCGKTEAAT